VTQPPRLTRKERQAQTRRELLGAASRVLAERGVQGASVEQIAAEAGYTKGAFYANFASKDELLLTMLEERFTERAEIIDELLARDAPLIDQAREGGDEFLRYVRGDRDWERLFFEFATHAARNEEFRRELVARYRALLERLTTAIATRADAAEFTPPGDVARFALMVFVAANGVALQQLLDPDGVPDDLLAGMLELLTLGAMAKGNG
jgi:AcrR family transcriptional regulator